MSRMQPLVSVIIPVYNSEEYLTETIASVDAQSYAQVETIIVNNCSDRPSTIQALGRLRESHAVVDSREKGLAIARNDGIAAATGEYILPLDSDDLIKATFIEQCVALFQAEPETLVVRTNIELFAAKKGVVEFDEYSYEKLLARNLMVATSMFRKRDWERIGGYDPKLKTCFEDWEFWIHLLQDGGNVGTIKDALFKYRIRRGSMMRSLNMDVLCKTRRVIWEKHKEQYAKHFLDPTESFEYQYLMDSKAQKIGTLLLKPFVAFKLMK